MTIKEGREWTWLHDEFRAHLQTVTQTVGRDDELIELLETCAYRTLADSPEIFSFGNLPNPNFRARWGDNTNFRVYFNPNDLRQSAVERGSEVIKYLLNILLNGTIFIWFMADGQSFLVIWRNIWSFILKLGNDHKIHLLVKPFAEDGDPVAYQPPREGWIKATNVNPDERKRHDSCYS